MLSHRLVFSFLITQLADHRLVDPLGMPPRFCCLSLANKLMHASQGVYSVPAWAPTGVQYAEWYNWQLHVPPNASSPTWTHHLETYGQDVVYDDFIEQWDTSVWNPDDWVDLFAEAGARYFVLTSKHHEGFTLVSAALVGMGDGGRSAWGLTVLLVQFDAGNSTNRSALLMGPK